MNKDELIDFDIDWFAIDKDGNIGIFCTAGSLAIPSDAMEFHEEPNIISKEFKLPHLGSANIWNDYASCGLFVYDYKVYVGPYLRMAFPYKSLEGSLKSRITPIKNLPLIDKSFKSDSTIEIAELSLEK